MGICSENTEESSIFAFTTFAQPNNVLKASRAKSANALKKLLKANADPNFQDEEGSTPLHIATSKGLETHVKFLLQGGADPSIADAGLVTPLILAEESGNDAIIKLLTEGAVALSPLSSPMPTPQLEA